MLHNIDVNKMNQLMEENPTAKQIISQLLENHHTTVSTIAHEIRNPLTLVSLHFLKYIKHTPALGTYVLPIFHYP